jgi:putative transposase
MIQKQFKEYKFKGKYRVKSTRLKNFDYSQNGYYFITICTKNHEYFFGEVKNDKMVLNKIGKIAEKFWLEAPNHFSNAKLDEFIIMPNHIHSIVIIKNYNAELCHVEPSVIETYPLETYPLETCPVETCHGMSLRKTNKFSKPIKKSLSMIINHYKGAVKRHCNKKDIVFAWQSKFYDHIIRNDKSLKNIREYIKYNPLKWDLDENNLQNIK